MKQRRSWWMIFIACAIVVAFTLGWISTVVVQLERDAAYQESLRLALWRMDSWIAPRLARESARPVFEYLAYYPHQRAYTRILSPIEPGEVLTPSPLLTFQSDFFTLHFQWSEERGWTSPQAPTSNLRDLAQYTCLPGDIINQNDAKLEHLASLVDTDQLRREIHTAETHIASLIDQPEIVAPSTKTFSLPQRQIGGKRGALAQQVQTNSPSVVTSENDHPPVIVGPMAPIWIADESEYELFRLIYIRRVMLEDKEIIQGLLVDWSQLHTALLDQIRDLFENVELAPIQSSVQWSDPGAPVLATIPVKLHADGLITDGRWLTPARSALGLTWLAVLIAIGAVSLTLHKSISFGEKRSRFASTVTHELRTPLTTFQMYSEMLAEGMVTDKQQQAEYLKTLYEESGRLGRLVENVLIYARLEEGCHQHRLQKCTFQELLEQIEPQLRRRAEEAGVTLMIDVSGETMEPLDVDADVIGQVLLNLVDNACKYGCNGEAHEIELLAKCANEKLQFAVYDHGPGVPASMTRSIFEPFERGGRDAGDTIPGVGLGLALSRGLARDFGGELTLETTKDPGACFVLTIPARRG